MNLIEYQRFAISTAVYPNIGKNWVYPLIGLSGEAGELANKLKKSIRDDHYKITNEKRNEVVDEMGDLFWYIVVLCYELGIDPDIVLQMNIKKLQKRQEENSIHGGNRSN